MIVFFDGAALTIFGVYFLIIGFETIFLFLITFLGTGFFNMTFLG
jgi:hypothetical protein